MIANSGQAKVISDGIDWYHNSSSTLFQIDGEAGTGKSYVLNHIVSGLRLQQENVLAMAYTGQAAIVMRTKGLIGATTCHSGLFHFTTETVLDPFTSLPIMDQQFNLPLVRNMFTPKDFRNEKNIKLIIIDEARMVPKSFRKYIDDIGIKTIVAGDIGQLPPVGDDPAYFVSGEVHHLTELMRQSQESPIVYLAHRARRGLPIECGYYGNQVLVVYEDEVDNRILQGADIVICGKNRTREDINTTVRKEFIHTDSDVPLFGERMICKKNNWQLVNDGIALANGLVGTVIRPPKVSNYDGKRFSMDFLPDLLATPFLDLKCDYSYLNAPHEEKQMIKNSKYSIGEKFDYAYASTVHSAQGSEYPSGIYIEEFLSPQIQNNLTYTAITRFKNRLIYVKRRPKQYFAAW